MDTIAFPVTDEGVVIPKMYLKNVEAIELVIHKNYVLLHPKFSPERFEVIRAEAQKRFGFIGIGEADNPNLAEEAEDILSRDAQRESGWSVAA